MSRLLVQEVFVPLCTTIIASISRMHCLRQPLLELAQSSIMAIKHYNSTKAKAKTKTKTSALASSTSAANISISSITSSPRFKNSPRLKHLRQRRMSSSPLQPHSQPQTPPHATATPSRPSEKSSSNSSFRASTHARTPFLKRSSVIFSSSTPDSSQAPEPSVNYENLVSTTTPTTSSIDNTTKARKSNKTRQSPPLLTFNNPPPIPAKLPSTHNTISADSNNKKTSSEIDDIFMILDM